MKEYGNKTFIFGEYLIVEYLKRCPIEKIWYNFDKNSVKKNKEEMKKYGIKTGKFDYI